MSQIDTNATLWANIEALMLAEWEEVNINRLARECKIGPATVVRIKDQKTSVGLEVLDKIADRFNLAVWQLLVPGMEPGNPPTLQPMSAAERRLHERVMALTKEVMAGEPPAAYTLGNPLPPNKPSGH